MPGKKYRSVKRPKVYEALKKRYGKAKAARIANSNATKRKTKTRRKR